MNSHIMKRYFKDLKVETSPYKELKRPVFREGGDEAFVLCTVLIHRLTKGHKLWLKEKKRAKTVKP